ncbi:MAG: formylglycine-generating enzyme family protein [Leptolyngbya sp. SIO4C1]|nr:formylglycine-generating enzyme family protein [Leptolyngbya sp. SIO4C1]
MVAAETKSKPVIQYRDRTAQFYTEDALAISSGQTPLDMVYIPPGIFQMGSPKGERGHRKAEGPQHSVTIVQPFFMGKYPVTQAQWRAVAALPQVKRDLNADPSNFKGDNRPVEQITWYDAVEFCQRLEKATDRPYRLPTEAEWEYACRAGTTTPFHFGQSITTDLTNYRGTDWEIGGTTLSGAYGDGPHGEFREETTDVGSFEAANTFGLYDMHGNVWEWCEDHWHGTYEGAPEDGSAWISSDKSKKSRVLRGGSWFSNPEICRSANRGGDAPDLRDNLTGFRVVCGLARD